MTTIWKSAAVLLFALTAVVPFRADDVVLRFDHVPESGLVVADVDLTAAARWCGVAAVTPAGIRAADGGVGTLQFIPDADFDPRQRVRGVLVARLPGGGSARLGLQFGPGEPNPETSDGRSRRLGLEIVHDPAKQGGLPSRLVFRGTGKALESIRWQDRTYHAQHGAFRIADDPQPQVTRIVDGPLYTPCGWPPGSFEPAENRPIKTGSGLPVAILPRLAAGVRDRHPTPATAIHLAGSPLLGTASIGRRTAAVGGRQSGPERRVQGGGKQSSTSATGPPCTMAATRWRCCTATRS